MTKFKELFEQILNEGTNATITVLRGDTFWTSFLQYSGSKDYMIPTLKKHFQSQKEADTLVTKTGDIREISQDGEVEYYNDRKILEITKDEEKALDNVNEAHIKYFFDGTDWFFHYGTVREFSKMKKI